MSSRIALVTHSTKPRGGFVHTLGIAEALHRDGVDVHLVALGDPAVGLPRSTPVPHTVLAGPSHAGTTLDERVFAAIDTLEAGLGRLAGRASTCCTRRTASPPAPRPGCATPAPR